MESSGFALVDLDDCERLAENREPTSRSDGGRLVGDRPEPDGVGFLRSDSARREDDEEQRYPSGTNLHAVTVDAG
jgi:hypothetical protein